MQTRVVGILLDGAAIEWNHSMALQADGVVPMRASCELIQGTLAVRKCYSANGATGDQAIDIAVHRGENNRRFVPTQSRQDVFHGHGDS